LQKPCQRGEQRKSKEKETKNSLIQVMGDIAVVYPGDSWHGAKALCLRHLFAIKLETSLKKKKWGGGGGGYI